ncbi:D-Ala-D-Ala carboxypeptidase family metallohydrolase [Halobacteriovorax sp. HLS]|uniref:D-Ala-D-Ala carboxypeptidase family metallohydrolase n=1 Tax=Halobacteriovorax sp. HLS TaxID=2234000 RepID=UPI0013E3D4EC|nr:D-Ala-D-Ala carboxypeptidase family metallohydrolase [Halobacteriovorax sp. HLS]
MKYVSYIVLALLVSCSIFVKNSPLNWEEIALLNGHSYNEDSFSERATHRNPSQVPEGETAEDKCEDQTQEELDNLDEFIVNFNGKVMDPEGYDFNLEGFQNYLNDSGLTKFFSAKEMITPNRKDVASSCGHKSLLPSKCRWKSAVAQGLLGVELRNHINKGRSASRGIKIRNWWRPSCYNKKVGGAKSSDHIQARGFDLDFATPKDRAVAQDYLCQMYKDKSPMSLQVGIGCQTLHIGIGSPKRLSRYPEDGARFWKYGSLNSCSIKRVSTDNCWKQAETGKLHIFTEYGKGIL